MTEAGALIIALTAAIGSDCSDDIEIDAWNAAIHPSVHASAEGVFVGASVLGAVGLVELVGDETSHTWQSDVIPWPIWQTLPQVSVMEDRVVVLWTASSPGDPGDEDAVYRAVIDPATGEASTTRILSGRAVAWGMVRVDDVLVAAISREVLTENGPEQRLYVSRSFDGGVSWTPLSPLGSHPMLRVNGLVTDRAGAIYCLLKPRPDLSYMLYRSLDRGVSWQHVRTFDDFNKATVASRHGTVVVAFSRRTQFITYFVSSDQGETWQEPVDLRPDDFYNYIYPEMTIDAYGTWHLIGLTDTRPDNILGRGNLVYVHSEDRGKTWSHPDTLNCVDVAAQLDTEWTDYRMATWRGDLFVGYLNNEGNRLHIKIAVRRREETQEASAPHVTLLTNPVSVNGIVRLSAHLGSAGRLRSVISSIDGRLVSAWTSGPLGPGDIQLEWDGRRRDGERAAAGVYFWRVSGEGVDETVQVVRY